MIELKKRGNTDELVNIVSCDRCPIQQTYRIEDKERLAHQMRKDGWLVLDGKHYCGKSCYPKDATPPTPQSKSRRF